MHEKREIGDCEVRSNDGSGQNVRHFQSPVLRDSAIVEATGGGVIPPPSVPAGTSLTMGGLHASARP